MNQLNRLTSIFGVVFIVLIANLTYIQVFDANSLNNNSDNRRSLFKQYDIDRGSIIISGQPVAYSVKTSGRFKYERRYVSAAFTHPVGYLSALYGTSGIEQSENSLLSGADDALAVDRIRQLLDGGARRGGSVELSLDSAAQQLAYQLLDNRPGAVVAIEPKTGKILVSASSPSFDANLLATTNAQNMQENWNRLLTDPEKPLLNRAYAETWPPGSTFKIVVAAAALESGRYTTVSKIPAPARYRLPGTNTFISNWQEGPCSTSGEVTLQEAIEVSCNTAFARLGVEIGSNQLRRTAEAFGFGSNFELSGVVPSYFPPRLDGAQTALVSIGQFDLRATTLQMAQIAAAIGNEGVVMQPSLIDNIFAPNLTRIRSHDSNVFNRAIKPATASALAEMMVSVVNSGTGTNAQISGISVAGKTGTAQTRPGLPAHAWFVGFAPANSTKIAIAVIVEGGEVGRTATSEEVSGNQLAAPIAQRLLTELLKRK
jgi:peptidoglycan glycosyltransferase